MLKRITPSSLALIIAVLGLTLIMFKNYHSPSLTEAVTNNNFSIELIPDATAINEKISKNLDRRIHDGQDDKDLIDLSTLDDVAMTTKLAAMIRASGNSEEPSDEVLTDYYNKSKCLYGGQSLLDFSFYAFSSAQFGGLAINKARQALLTKKNSLELRADDFTTSGTFTGVYEKGNEKESEIYKTFGSSFGEKLMQLITSNKDQVNRCWLGPISNRKGSYIVCINSILITDPPPLDQVRDEVVNDWRLSTIKNP